MRGGVMCQDKSQLKKSKTSTIQGYHQVSFTTTFNKKLVS